MVEVKNERFDPKTNEYIYDVEMSPEELENFTKLSNENGMTVEEYARYAVEEALKDPEKIKRLAEMVKEEELKKKK